jgi:predicted ferric reductase
MKSGERHISPEYFLNNAPRHVSYAIYALFNVALFAFGAWRYTGHGLLVQIARGAGACMNFNAAYCLLPMMRLTISQLRRTRFSRYLALEEGVVIHRVAGHVMFGFAVVHTEAYLVLYGVVSKATLSANLMSTRASITGWILALDFLLMWVFALEWIRRRWRFEMFYVTHFVGVPLVLLLLFHSPHYWKWFLVGGIGYLLDRAVRFWRMRVPSEIISAKTLRSKVTELVIARPPDFDYRAGDFVFILIPALSGFEWHPFTISSAPERKDAFTIHARTLGDWTERLFCAFRYWNEWKSGGGANASNLSPRVVERLQSSRDRLPVYIDGPHGAPANDIANTRVAVLIAAGIGVTPFASLLQSLVHRAAQGSTSELEHVYFIWINRDQTAFEWFNTLLSDLKERDHRGLFDAHLFVTDPPQGELPPLTRHGIPDWDSELDAITDVHLKEQIGLFYCGPPALAKIIHRQAATRGLRFKVEHF